MAVTFSHEFEETLHRSLAIANNQRSRQATTEHLLLALLGDKETAPVLLACKGNLDQLRSQLEAHLQDELPVLQTRLPDEITKPLTTIWSSWRRLLLNNSPAEPRHSDDGDYDAKPTAAFQRVIQRAVINIQSSGREIVTGANALVAIMAERDSVAEDLLLKQGITRYDLVNYITYGIPKETNIPNDESAVDDEISREIEESSSAAPVFLAVEGRLHFEQTPAIDQIGERKALVQERLSSLKHLSDLRANEHPEFKKLIDNYGEALAKIGPRVGVYALFMAGFDIETFLKIKAQSAPDRDRNPPLDADQLFATQSLIIAHAGLITLFPDVQSVTTELDRYRQMAESLDALRDRVLDPIFDQLSRADQVFDNETLQIASGIQQLDKSALNVGVPITQGATSVKHSWIRGALGAIGQYLLKQVREVGKVARDSVVKEGVTHLTKHPDQLVAAMVGFLAAAKPVLLSLADTLQAQFGWIVSLLSRLGL